MMKREMAGPLNVSRLPGVNFFPPLGAGRDSIITEDILNLFPQFSAALYLRRSEMVVSVSRKLLSWPENAQLIICRRIYRIVPPEEKIHGKNKQAIRVYILDSTNEMRRRIRVRGRINLLHGHSTTMGVFNGLLT